MSPRTSIVNQPTTFDCNYCEKVYTLKGSLQSHLKSKHNKKVAENAIKTEAIVASCGIIMDEIVQNVMTGDSERQKVMVMMK